MKEMNNRDGSLSLFWTRVHLFFCAVTWPYCSYDTASPCPKALSHSTLLQDSIAFFVPLFGQETPKSILQVPFGSNPSYFAFVYPTSPSPPPRPLSMASLFISTTRSQTPQQKITSFLSAINQLPQPPHALVMRSSNRHCSQDWLRKRLERNGIHLYLLTVSVSVTNL